MTPASKDLTNKNIPHREFTHPLPVDTLEQAAEERNQEPNQVIRSILFNVKDADYVMVLTGGPKQISWRNLRRTLGVSRMRMATPEEVFERTGFVVGSVSPFGLPDPVRILVEQDILSHEEVSIGSGVRGTTIFIKPADLVKALGDYEVVDFS